MSKRAEDFQKSKERYWEETQQPWARMMSELLRAQLQMNLPGKGSRVLDVGCGFGLTGHWLAAQGYQVKGVDFQADLFEVGRELAAESGVQVEYELFKLDEDAAEGLGGPYEMVMCHNVLEYVQDAREAVEKMHSVTRDNGVLSLVCHNPHAKVLKAAVLQNDPVEALGSMNRKQFYSQTLDTHATVYPLTDLIEILSETGWQIVARYGIRSVYDLIANTSKFDEAWHRQAFELEMALGQQSPYRDVAMFTHLVARKRANS